MSPATPPAGRRGTAPRRARRPPPGQRQGSTCGSAAIIADRPRPRAGLRARHRDRLGHEVGRHQLQRQRFRIRAQRRGRGQARPDRTEQVDAKSRICRGTRYPTEARAPACRACPDATATRARSAPPRRGPWARSPSTVAARSYRPPRARSPSREVLRLVDHHVRQARRPLDQVPCLVDSTWSADDQRADPGPRGGGDHSSSSARPRQHPLASLRQRLGRRQRPTPAGRVHLRPHHLDRRAHRLGPPKQPRASGRRRPPGGFHLDCSITCAIRCLSSSRAAPTARPLAREFESQLLPARTRPPATAATARGGPGPPSAAGSRTTAPPQHLGYPRVALDHAAARRRPPDRHRGHSSPTVVWPRLSRRAREARCGCRKGTPGSGRPPVTPRRRQPARGRVQQVRHPVQPDRGLPRARRALHAPVWPTSARTMSSWSGWIVATMSRIGPTAAVRS